MRKGFTLIELLVVITILAILVGAALPYVQNYVAESRQAKAKSDLDEISRALVIYESREGTYNKSTVEDLTGRYLDRSPIDPWGVPYRVATESGIVYSCGPDRKDVEYDGTGAVVPATEANKYDNIEVSYVPPLALVSAKWVDKNKSGAVDTQNVSDELHLTFSRILGKGKGTGKELNDKDSKLLESVELLVDPNTTPPTWVPLRGDPSLENYIDDVNMMLVGASRTIVLPLNSEYDNGTAPKGKGHFIAGQDKIRIRNDHQEIVDIAKDPNYCIAEQEVIILPQ